MHNSCKHTTQTDIVIQSGGGLILLQGAQIGARALSPPGPLTITTADTVHSPRLCSNTARTVTLSEWSVWNLWRNKFYTETSSEF